MKSSPRLIAALPLAALFLAGCGASTPTRYYTLIAPNAYAAPTPATAPGYAIDVEPVQVPAQVDQPAIVLRQGDGQLAIADEHRWAASLPEELRGALAADLAARLSVPELHGAAATPGTRIWKIAVDIQRFDSQLDHSVTLGARWSLRPSDTDRPTLVCSSSFSLPVAPGWPALVDGHQRAVARLADAISGSLRGAIGGAAVCPGAG